MHYLAICMTARSVNQRSVMVVDDDLDIREALLDLLAENDFAAVGASDGREALAHLNSGAELPCVILLDIMMPVMDGWQFRAAQRTDARLADIPVIVISAHASAQAAAKGMEAAASLRKPVRADELLTAVSRFCPPRDASAR